MASEPEEPLVDDEPGPQAPPVADDGRDALRAVPSLLAAMPVGTEVGTFVHRVLEATDFAAADLDASWSAEIAAAQARRRVELGDGARSSPGCAPRSRRRSGRSPAASRLRDIARGDRLDELNFELPLAGGDEPTGAALTLAAIAAVLRRHLPPTTRWPATPTGSATRGCARASAATSPAASTSSCGVARARASRSSTTRRTGSRLPARR